MKKLLITAFLTLCATACIAFTASACGKSGNPQQNHVHQWEEKWQHDGEHHWHRCTEGICWEKGSFGTHDFSTGRCYCGRAKYTPGTDGLEYKSLDGETYAVTGIGSATGSSIAIPSEYKGAPVTSIADSAFSGCETLMNVTIPNSITRIEKNAFTGTGLYNNEENWQNGVLYIGKNLIRANENLSCDEDIETDNADMFFAHAYRIKDGAEVIADGAFEKCIQLYNVIIPASVSYVGTDVFHGCDFLVGIHISNLTAWCNITFSDCASWLSGSYHADLYLNKKLVTELEIPNGFEQIGDNTFGGFRAIQSVFIPDSVKRIGNSAFYRCSGIKNITIPESVTSIGQSAFMDCSGLTRITIPKSVTTIEEHAFSNSFALTIFCETETKPESWTFSWNHIYGSSHKAQVPTVWNYKNNRVAQDGCIYTYIGKLRYALKDGKANVVGQSPSLTEKIMIPETVAFENETYFVTEIGDFAFYQCDGITEITIPEGITKIGDNTFDGCSSLTEITLPESVTAIGRFAFHGCSRLTRISLPESLTELGDAAFVGCYRLSEINLPDGLTKIGSSSFLTCNSLTSLTLPTSITALEWQAFCGCRALESLILSVNIQKISWQAFKDCPQLELFYLGSQQEWENITFEHQTPSIPAVFFYSETKPTDSGNFWHFADDGKTPLKWNTED